MSLLVMTQISSLRVDRQESVTYLDRLGLKVLQGELTLALGGLAVGLVGLCGPAAFKAFAPGTYSEASTVQ